MAGDETETRQGQCQDQCRFRSPKGGYTFHLARMRLVGRSVTTYLLAYKLTQIAGAETRCSYD